MTGQVTSESDVIVAWEIAARRPGAQSKIHPSGGNPRAYWRTGQDAAKRVLDITVRYGRLNPELATFLDYGCGDGRVLYPLQQMVPGSGVFGYDTSPTMLERAAGYGCRNLVDCPDDIPISDVVFAVSVLIHHDHDAGERLLGRMAAVTNPGGLVIVTLPLHDVERVRSGWIDVTAWSPARFDRVADHLGLEVVQSPRYDGPFTYTGSKTNDHWHVLRKKDAADAGV